MKTELRPDSSALSRYFYRDEHSVWNNVKRLGREGPFAISLQIMTDPMQLGSYEYLHGQPLKGGVKPAETFDSVGNTARVALAVAPFWRVGKFVGWDAPKYIPTMLRNLKNLKPLRPAGAWAKRITKAKAARNAAASEATSVEIGKTLYGKGGVGWVWPSPVTSAKGLSAMASPLRTLANGLFRVPVVNPTTSPFWRLATDAAYVGAESLAVKLAASRIGEVRDDNMKREATTAGAGQKPGDGEKAVRDGALSPTNAPPSVATNAAPPKVDVLIADALVRQAQAESNGDTNRFASAVAAAAIPKEALDEVRQGRYAQFFRKRNGMPLATARNVFDNTEDPERKARMGKMISESEAAFAELDSNTQLMGGN